MSTDTLAAAQLATGQILTRSFTHAATIVKAPPGAGKSTLCGQVVAAHVALGHRVAVATPTRAQGHDLTSTIAATYPEIPILWFGKDGPENIAAVTAGAELPDIPSVAVGTVARWGYQRDGGFDLLVVDEAFQVTDAAFGRIGHLADRVILMGDPGQIAPVVTVDVNEWAADVDSPVAPAPTGLLHRHPDVPVVELPATWRFGADTAAVVSDGFYDWQWGSNRNAGHLSIPGDPVLEHLGAEREIVHAELPARPGVPRTDRDLASAIATMATRALSVGTVVTAEGTRPVKDVFVVAAHIDQVASATSALAGLPGVSVDTAERLQGRQADLVFAWHPASGMVSASDFQRDAGRLCVMLSRHKYGVVLVSRAGTLALPVTGTGRTLAHAEDPVRRAARAAATMNATMASRTISLTV